MENFSTVLFIVGAIQLITLIVFFVMASNIAVIKKSLKPKSKSDYINLAEEEKYIGNLTLAKEYYLRAKFIEESNPEPTYDSTGRQNSNKAKLDKIDEMISKL